MRDYLVAAAVGALLSYSSAAHAAQAYSAKEVCNGVMAALDDDEDASCTYYDGAEYAVCRGLFEANMQSCDEITSGDHDNYLQAKEACAGLVAGKKRAACNQPGVAKDFCWAWGASRNPDACATGTTLQTSICYGFAQARRDEDCNDL